MSVVALVLAMVLPMQERAPPTFVHGDEQLVVSGDIFHGRLTLDQLFSARPVLGTRIAAYRPRASIRADQGRIRAGRRARRAGTRRAVLKDLRPGRRPGP